MRELESRTARARARRVDALGHPDASAEVARVHGDDATLGTMLASVRDASHTGRLITRAGAHKSSSGRRDDGDDDNDDDSKDDKKGQKKDSKGGGKGKKKSKDDDKPKKHPIQPPAPHGPPPPSFPHPPPHLPPPHGPPPKGPHPPFHPHPKVALSSSSSADDPLTTPVAKPSKSSGSTAETSAPTESIPPSVPSHESQTYAGSTITEPSQPVSTDVPKQGPQPHTTTSSLPLAPAQSSSGGRKGFPLAAAGVLGGVLSFLLVSGIVWGIWFWMRRRRRVRAPTAHWDFPPPAPPLRPQSDGITVSTRTISTTLPQFASAAEAGVTSSNRPAPNSDMNPFAHPGDARERDPFSSAPPTLRLGTIDAPLSRMFI